MKALTDDQRIKRQLGILAAATKVLAAGGPDALTMDRVAGEAGLAKGTLFLYYRSKEELVLAIMESWVDELAGKLDAILAAAEPPEARLRSLVLALLSNFDRRRDLTGYSIGLPVSPAARSGLRGRFEANMKRIAAILESCAAGGLLELDDPMFAASSLFGLCRGSTVYARSAGRHLPVQERTARVMKIFLNGTRRLK